MKVFKIQNCIVTIVLEVILDSNLYQDKLRGKYMSQESLNILFTPFL